MKNFIVSMVGFMLLGTSLSFAATVECEMTKSYFDLAPTGELIGQLRSNSRSSVTEIENSRNLQNIELRFSSNDPVIGRIRLNSDGASVSSIQLYDDRSGLFAFVSNPSPNDSGSYEISIENRRNGWAANMSCQLID